jgi:hypothetical protein
MSVAVDTGTYGTANTVLAKATISIEVRRLASSRADVEDDRPERALAQAHA